MRSWNYVVTAHKPTVFTHSCVGNFTAPDHLNLIVSSEGDTSGHIGRPTDKGQVDLDGSRYLFGDNTGGLHLVVVTHEQGRVTSLKIHYMGETSIASTISYIDNGVVYIGSQFGDSQLIKLNNKADASGLFVEVLEQYVNIGPIADFCCVDLDKQGQGQLIACSGLSRTSRHQRIMVFKIFIQ
ncbi:hypothetical protein E2562_005945 [Oryza meyeriana var. granulata]|uniref:RSE1/DDB1/CPSF1 first beta-propeller domain-containing protein n=1 Tax=Oryza meyeriana var. granulata TaxID=110450 RepID=A0A6G1DV97_9ORYZ|nr:hypothetical protein E2562_005945 [Oryza meyeriana var. granulata]